MCIKEKRNNFFFLKMKKEKVLLHQNQLFIKSSMNYKGKEEEKKQKLKDKINTLFSNSGKEANKIINDLKKYQKELKILFRTKK